MTDNIQQFFDAYLTEGIRSVYAEDVPKDMMASEVNEDGWYKWKLIRGTMTNGDYERVATQCGSNGPG